MSKLINPRHCCVLCLALAMIPVVIFNVTSAATAQTVRSQQSEPPDLLSAASNGIVTEFALALARSNTPVGVFLEDGTIDMGKYVAASQVKDHTGRVDEALKVFRSKRPDERIDRTNTGGIVLAPEKLTSCVAPARGRRLSLAATGPVVEVLYKLVRAWNDDQSQYMPPGVLGDEDRDTYLLPVGITVSNGTFEDALNLLIQQVPGLGWSIQERKSSLDKKPQTSECSVGLFTGRSWIQSDWILNSQRP